MRKLGIAAISTAVWCFAAVETTALEAQAFLDRFETALELNFTYDFEFGPAKHKGDVIVASGMTIGDFCPYLGAEPLRIDGELRFAGVGEEPDGDFHARSLSIPAFEATFEDTGDTIMLSLGSIELADIQLAPGDMRVTDAAEFVARARLDGIAASIEGYSVLSAEAIDVTTTSRPAPGGDHPGELSDNVTVAGIEVDLATISLLLAPAGTLATLEGLGLGTIRADLAISQDWVLSGDRVSAGKVTLRVEDKGTLFFEVGYSGYTAEVWQETTGDLYQAYTTTDCTDPALLADAESRSWTALREAVSLNHAWLRYEDVSLVGDLIALFAQDEGTDNVTAARSLGKSLAHLLAAGGFGDFSAAIAAFLSDPQSFALATDLESPVSLGRIGDALYGGDTLSDLLHIEATANADE